MQIDAYAAVERAHRAVAVPRLRLYEDLVRQQPLAYRVARRVGVDIPVVVVLARDGYVVAVFVDASAALVGICRPEIGVGLGPCVVLQLVADIYGRQVGQREVVLGHALQRYGVCLLDEEAVVAILVVRLGVGQPHRHAGRHLEGGVDYGPLADYAAVFARVDHVVHVGRMHRVALARMGECDREGMVLRALPLVLAHGAARLVADVGRCRGRHVLRVHQLEVLLAVAFLSRFDIHQIRQRRLSVVERHVVDAGGVCVVGACEDEVGRLPAFEPVDRLRRLSQSAQRHVARAAAVERIIDAPVGQRGVERLDLDAVEVAVDIPFPVSKRAYRVVEIV